MTSIIKLTCLSGGKDDNDDSCPIPCYLLQIDQFKCLLDCGWDAKFSSSIVEEIEKHYKTLDAILLSYPDPAHLGALPYLIKKHGLPCPIYCTRPITLMGQMFMTDLLLSRLNNQEFDLFNMDDIKKTFENDKTIHLNYNQTYHLEGQGHGLTLTPLAAGHMIGGTIWKIVKDNEEDIIYAIDYNHMKERHLNGCVLNTVSHPSLLITDAHNACNVQVRKSERDAKFMTAILDTLRGGGNILIACDTAGRILEIANMLDNIWRKEPGLSAYSLALVNNVAVKMVDITMSTLEWMSDNILNEFEKNRGNPFKFKHLELKQSLNDLGKLRQPITVLATQPDLESGFARDLFTLWSQEAKNSIIFTQRPSPGTLGYQVFCQRTNPLEIEIWQRLELQGEELEEFKKREEEKKQQALIESQKALAIHDSDSEDDETAREILNESISSKALAHKPSKHDLMMNNGREEGSMFFKQARKTYPMFPAPMEKEIKIDDYGEIINPEDYVLFHKMQATSKTMAVEDDKENETSKTSDMNGDEIEEPEVKPTKCVSIKIALNILAKVDYFDFEGRSDGQSVKNLVSQIRPRRLILVKGSRKSTEFMANYCRAYVDESEDHKIFQPETGQTVDATTENYIYQVKLKDSLVSSLNFVEADAGVELAWVDAKSLMPEEDDISQEKLPHLDALEPEQVPLHNAIFVNELKLQDFREVLRNNKIQAEISGGILYCNDKVTVRKRGSGRIHLEGPLCDDYYKVRDLLYSQYVII